MKLKTLKKKIRRLETRLQEGPAKLVRMKRKLEAIEKTKARKAGRKSAVRARARQTSSSAKKVPAKAGGRKNAQPSAKKAKRKINLSPERRAQLAAAMKARWAARRSAKEVNSQSGTGGGDFAVGQTPAISENPFQSS